MSRSLAFSLLAALPFLVSAQSPSPTLNLFFPGFDNQTLEGSIIAVNGPATTLAVACPSTEDSNDCGLFGPLTYTLGPSTVDLVMDYTSAPFVYSVSLHCSSSVSTNIVCSETDSQVVPATGTYTATTNVPLTTMTSGSVTTVDPTDIATIPVAITAGASLLSGASASSTGTGTSKSSAKSSSTSSSSGAAKSTGAAVANLAGGSLGLGVAAAIMAAL